MAAQVSTGQVFTDFLHSRDQLLVSPSNRFWYLKLKISKATVIFAAECYRVTPYDIVHTLSAKSPIGAEVMGFVRKGRFYVMNASYAWTSDFVSGKLLQDVPGAPSVTLVDTGIVASEVIKKYVWPRYKNMKAVPPKLEERELLQQDINRYSSAQNPLQTVNIEAEAAALAKQINLQQEQWINGICIANTADDFLNIIGINMSALAGTKGKWEYIRKHVTQNVQKQAGDPKRRLIDALYGISGKAKLVTAVLNVNGRTFPAKVAPEKLLREVRFNADNMSKWNFEQSNKVMSCLGINTWDPLSWQNIQEITYNRKTLYQK